MAPGSTALCGAAVLAAAAAGDAQNRKPAPPSCGVVGATAGAAIGPSEIFSSLQNLLPGAAEHCENAAAAPGVLATTQRESCRESASMLEPRSRGEEAMVERAKSSAVGGGAVARAHGAEVRAAKEARSKVDGRAAAPGMKSSWESKRVCAEGGQGGVVQSADFLASCNTPSKRAKTKCTLYFFSGAHFSSHHEGKRSSENRPGKARQRGTAALRDGRGECAGTAATKHAVCTINAVIQTIQWRLCSMCFFLS